MGNKRSSREQNTGAMRGKEDEKGRGTLMGRQRESNTEGGERGHK